jgi:hypothetical protein
MILMKSDRYKSKPSSPRKRAKAGIQGGNVLGRKPRTPAFAGDTSIFRGRLRGALATEQSKGRNLDA